MKLEEINPSYSTTRRVVKADPAVISELIKKSAKPENKFETLLFLPEGEGRKGEGGLRTKGYFKVGGLIPEHKVCHSEEKDRHSCEGENISSHLTEFTSPETKPLITVVTVVYNGEKYLEETILSVINQTYDNVEYIIIDGGSTDGTLDIIKKYEHAIDYWVSEKDKGIYDAMNKGIDVASGEWVNFMNAEDEFYHDKVLENVAQELIPNKICLYGGVVWKNGKKMFPFIMPYFLRMPNHQAMFTKLEWLKKNKFDLSFSISADLDMKMKIHAVNGFSKSSATICLCQEGGVSQDPSNLSKVQKEMILIHKKNYIISWPYILMDKVYQFIKKIHLSRKGGFS